jgi:oligopeptide/dipeptide ABC transporter ATP-binding protein
MTDSANRENPLLTISGLGVSFSAGGGWLPILEDINLEVRERETVGLVGESGCGKSTTALSILRLLGRPEDVRVDGEIRFAGRDLLLLDERTMRNVRGCEIAIVPQDPYSSLNPLFTIGQQIRETLKSHRRAGRDTMREAVIESLRRVRISNPEQRMRQYPHELSGGLRQRAVGAIATACGARLLIADEPTTALDATVQAAYLDMLSALQAETGLAMLFITHDLGVVARICDRVAVMYAGRVVESGSVEDVFYRPVHWYTRGLLASMPAPDRAQQRLAGIAGSPPAPGSVRQGCRFAGRCSAVRARCREAEPPVEQHGPGHEVRCWYPVEEVRPDD